MDGAAYHRAKSTLDMLKRLNIPISMMGPYSYDAASIEIFFAMTKSVDLNPDSLPLGKSNFQNVLNLVVERCKQIPKHHLILNWHHCLLYIYKYLSFFKI